MWPAAAASSRASTTGEECQRPWVRNLGGGRGRDGYFEPGANISKLKNCVSPKGKVEVVDVEGVGIEEVQPGESIAQQPLGHAGAPEGLEEGSHFDDWFAASESGGLWDIAADTRCPHKVQKQAADPRSETGTKFMMVRLRIATWSGVGGGSELGRGPCRRG